MRMNGRNAMRSVKMKKDELLMIVRQNKIKHIAEYDEAVNDYKTLTVKITKENAKLANTGDLEKIKEIKGIPSAPRSYESDYNRAARMLELSVEDVIELEDDVFNQLVLDEWSWKQSFTVSNSSYKLGM
jgi:hypothetical protein